MATEPQQARTEIKHFFSAYRTKHECLYLGVVTKNEKRRIIVLLTYPKKNLQKIRFSHCTWFCFFLFFLLCCAEKFLLSPKPLLLYSFHAEKEKRQFVSAFWGDNLLWQKLAHLVPSNCSLCGSFSSTFQQMYCRERNQKKTFPHTGENVLM